MPSHALVADLVPGGISKEVAVCQARSLLADHPSIGAVAGERHALALDLVDELERLKTQRKALRKRIAVAVDECGASREQPLEFEGIRRRHLPEDRAHARAQHHKAEYALRAAAMSRAGVDPGLLDEVSWWRTDDLWFWALQALVTYVRAAGEHSAEPVTAICGRVASRHGVQLAAAT
jgi:hypothetical protein